jgi:asparagine synthase (glutamine-hydrolysing)
MEAMEPHLPAEVLYRSKMGFAVPLARWFRGPLRERMLDSLLGPRLADTGYFDRAFLKHLVQRHESGARDYSAAIWTLLMFDAFLRSAMDSRQGVSGLRLAS